jgi:hypothetical protein
MIAMDNERCESKECQRENVCVFSQGIEGRTRPDELT